MSASRHEVALICMDDSEAVAARLRRNFPRCEMRAGPSLPVAGISLPDELLRGVTVLLTSMPPANFRSLADLRWLQLSSTGYSQVFDLPIVERGIRVTNSRGVFDVPIAEWNIMMMLVWQRRLLELLALQRSATWDPAPRFQGELRGASVGFFGYGGIARETARLAKTMGMHVLVLTRDGQIKPRTGIYHVPGTGDMEGSLPDRVFSNRERSAFLEQIDYLVISVPLTPATEGQFGERELRALKSSAVLINPARARIIEEASLLLSLREGWIRGASLDVHYAYPLPSEHPLWNMPNVILTPHISGNSGNPRFAERILEIFRQNLERFQDGRGPLLNELTTAQLRGE